MKLPRPQELIDDPFTSLFGPQRGQPCSGGEEQEVIKDPSALLPDHKGKVLFSPASGSRGDHWIVMINDKIADTKVLLEDALRSARFRMLAIGGGRLRVSSPTKIWVETLIAGS